MRSSCIWPRLPESAYMRAASSNLQHAKHVFAWSHLRPASSGTPLPHHTKGQAEAHTSCRFPIHLLPRALWRQCKSSCAALKLDPAALPPKTVVVVPLQAMWPSCLR